MKTKTNTNKYEYEQLFQELTQYEKEGVRIKMDNRSASPMQVISVHLVKETNTYMRDYIISEEGRIEELCFHKIREENL
jgi:hypothetical protein